MCSYAHINAIYNAKKFINLKVLLHVLFVIGNSNANMWAKLKVNQRFVLLVKLERNYQH